MNYRVTHSDDPVPRLLGTKKVVTKHWQYSQSSPEYWIISNNTANVTPSDIEVIQGIDNTAGNLGQTGCDFQAHQWYIGNMTGCSRNGQSGNSTGFTKMLCDL
jgi:triacylglycerol lipase